MKNTACVWCGSIIRVRELFNEKTQKAVCSQSCKDAEMLFNVHWSDEEINRRTHYIELTKGNE
jgi:hypothetical protein